MNRKRAIKEGKTMEQLILTTLNEMVVMLKEILKKLDEIESSKKET